MKSKFYLSTNVATITFMLFIFFVSCAQTGKPRSTEPGDTELTLEKIAPIKAPFEMPQLQRPVFQNKIFDITKYGAIGDSIIKNTEAFQKAIEACNEAGGGLVIVPAGKWFTGAIHLKSNVNLHMQEGAEIHFSDDRNDYLPVVFTRWAGFEVMNYSPLIYAVDCENIAVTGPGKLFGHGESWWHWQKLYEGEDGVGKKLQGMVLQGVPAAKRVFGDEAVGGLRPQFINPVRCKNVLLEGFTIATAGPFWTIHFLYCENVIARRLTIHTNQGGENTDGINMDSSHNGLIEHCVIDSKDDAVCIKSGINEDGRRIGIPTENIVIRNVTAYNTTGGFCIGSEMSGNVKNIYVHDCKYLGSRRGIRIKSNASRGGIVEDIYFKSIKMANIALGAIIFETNYKSWMSNKNGKTYPIFRNIEISNLSCDGAGKGAWLFGTKNQPIENITFKDIDIKSNTGMEFDFVNNLKLINVKSEPESGKPFAISNCKGVTMEPN